MNVNEMTGVETVEGKRHGNITWKNIIKRQEKELKKTADLRRNRSKVLGIKDMRS